MEKVSLVKCNSYNKEEVYKAVKKSIELIGGLKIKPGSKVLIKPNLLRPKHPKYAVTTHPEVIRAIIKLFKEKKCRIFVGDSPGFHDSTTTAKVCGILDICKQEDVPFINFKKKKVYMYKEAILMKRFELSDILDKVDYIINVPKLKTHVMMGVTLAIKNTFGFIVGLNKSQLHFKLKEKEKFASMLVDLNNFVKPTINIMDGIIGMEGEGPGNGDPINSGIISASYDSLSMDITLCKVIGFDPLSIWTNKIALSKKNKDFIKDIQVVGEQIKDVKIKFKPSKQKPLSFVLPKGIAKVLGNLITAKPKINPKKCKACCECIKICPAKTISLKKYKGKKTAFIDKKYCIRCYCCHEICPYNAIDIKRSIAGEFLDLLQKILT
ncbi:MAG: DUF362 domain-containing protein [Nanoarchaeota archaeon]|nr:DUF362 domain-containing protein [Nanoarchaeota archaeon]MBU1004779.1 DUF362 domain-containing protein [Nanoarchaeota archaeon]MBU1945551.1 DUF362 domain-containing protein [Nanoarchaeota archaeon]